MKRLFFYLFFFWSKKKEYREFSGLNALVTLLFLSVLNILSIVSFSTFFTEDKLVVFPEYFNSKVKILTLVLVWGAFLGLLLLKRSDFKYYRERIEKLNEDQAIKARSYALFYIITSLVVFFVFAFTVVKRLP